MLSDFLILKCLLTIVQERIDIAGLTVDSSRPAYGSGPWLATGAGSSGGFSLPEPIEWFNYILAVDIVNCTEHLLSFWESRSSMWVKKRGTIGPTTN